MEEKKAKLQLKREELARKARRGEIDPMHEHAFQVISQVRRCFLNDIYKLIILVKRDESP